MQIGIDSFAAAISDPATGLTLSPVERMHHLLRETHGCRNATSFSAAGHRCPMKQLFPSTKLCVLRHGPSWLGLSPNKSALPASSVPRFATFPRTIYVLDVPSDLLCSARQSRRIPTPTPPYIQFP